MSVYFIYRSEYAGPSGKHVRRLEADSVLGWFQGAWERAKQADDVSEWVKTEIGADVYGFASIFEAAREQSLPPPTSDRQLRTCLEENLYVEGDLKYKPHALQVLTDDDELELAYYLFDDHYLEEHPGKAAYLLHEGWRLPTTSRENPAKPSITVKTVLPRGSSSGVTYLVFLAAYDSSGLSELDEVGGPCRIQGVRLPQLSDYLQATAGGEDWPIELTIFRSQIRAQDPSEFQLKSALERVARLPVIRLGEMNSRPQPGQANIDEARDYYANTVSALAGVFDHDASKSLVATSDHILQLCLHAGECFGQDVHHQWIIFDDLWVGQHQALADGLLRFAKRWDIFT